MRSYLVKLARLSYSVIFMGLCIIHCKSAAQQSAALESEVFMADEKNMMQPEIKSVHQHVVKRVLDNGLTVLIHESHEIPKVSLQIWYNVGSKDELLGEKGIAHLIEHMIFKGTDT